MFDLMTHKQSKNKCNFRGNDHPCNIKLMLRILKFKFQRMWLFIYKCYIILNINNELDAMPPR